VRCAHGSRAGVVLEDGRIVSYAFGHTSSLRFLETRFGTKAPNLTMNGGE
jgi:hypothetical protein